MLLVSIDGPASLLPCWSPVLSNVCSAQCASPFFMYPALPCDWQNAAKGTQGKTVGLVLNTPFSR